MDAKTEFEPTVSRCARGSFANYAGTYIRNTGLVFEGNPVFKSYINESAKARTIKPLNCTTEKRPSKPL